MTLKAIPYMIPSVCALEHDVLAQLMAKEKFE